MIPEYLSFAFTTGSSIHLQQIHFLHRSKRQDRRPGEDPGGADGYSGESRQETGFLIDGRKKIKNSRLPVFPRPLLHGSVLRGRVFGELVPPCGGPSPIGRGPFRSFQERVGIHFCGRGRAVLHTMFSGICRPCYRPLGGRLRPGWRGRRRGRTFGRGWCERSLPGGMCFL